MALPYDLVIIGLGSGGLGVDAPPVPEPQPAGPHGVGEGAVVTRRGVVDADAQVARRGVAREGVEDR